jgi:tetratricopeptide (TPR) repeat protein
MEEMKSINEMARLIVATDYDFVNLFHKTHISDRMKVLKTALSLKRGLATTHISEKTGIRCIDIYIIKLDLGKHIKKGELREAVEIASKAIKKYPEYLEVIQDELLEVAKLARKNKIFLSFDPRKFKYNLSSGYIHKYILAMDEIDFHLEQDVEYKLKHIEQMLKKYPGNTNVLQIFLDFLTVNSSIKYDDKKLLQHVRAVLSTNPIRELASYLLKLNKKNILELAQEQMTTIENDNLEKLWLLLVIATKMNILARAKELIQTIIEIDKTKDIYKFYVENMDILSADANILQILLKRS